MNSDELNQILREARVPGRADDYWKGFPGQVIHRLQNEAAVLRPYRAWRIGAALCVSAACGILIGFAVWHRRPPSDAYTSLMDGRIFRELQAEYPGRLKAVIEDGTGLHTQLSDVADVSMSHPVLVEIRDGIDRRVVVTFSGQLVRCGDREAMVLSDGSGKVMLVGDGFFWSHQTSAGIAHTIQIRAEQLNAARVDASNNSPL
jgi:hypothetical protein